MCHATEGEPLGHSPGHWQESVNTVSATVTKFQHCTVCNELTASEIVPLNTLIQNGLFRFTPKEFMERLKTIADKHINGFTYEFVPSSIGLQVLAYCNDKQAIVQFFRSDTTALEADEMDIAEIWCVNLCTVNETDAAFRHCFFMACDPALDKDTALGVDIDLTTAFLDSANKGEPFGYYQNNDLLYETWYITEGALGQDYSMNLVNIYASDFR